MTGKSDRSVAQRRLWGEITSDRYGRPVPKHAHGTRNLDQPTSSARKLREAAAALFDRIADPGLLVRRLYVTAGRAVPEENIKKKRFMNSWICLPIIWR